MSTFKDEIMTPEVPFELWTTPQWIIAALVAIAGLATYTYFDSITRPFIEFLVDEGYPAWQKAFIGLITLAPIAAILTTIFYLSIAIPRHLDASFRGVVLVMSPYLLTGIISGLRAVRRYSTTSWAPLVIAAIPVVAAAYGVGSDVFARQAAGLNMSSLGLFLLISGSIIAIVIGAATTKNRPRTSLF